MGDYVEEINTALSAQDKDFYYGSLEDVVSDLESEKWDRHEQAKKRAAQGLGITGTGVAGWMFPEFYTHIAEQADSITQNDLASIGLVGALGISTLPAYLTKRSVDERDEIDQMIEKLEEGNYDEDDTDFDYDVAEKLS